MALSLYAAVVPSQIQLLGSVLDLMVKAEAFWVEEGGSSDDLLAARLTDDMLPLAYQLKSTVVHSIGAIEGVRRGTFSPDMSPPSADLESARTLLRDAISALRAIEPAELDAFVGRDMRFAFGEYRIDFTADDFLLSFAQPNFYFHATTVYAILRARGVPIGKRDFLGRLRIRT